LWECPRCGARLVARNLSHSCGDHSIEKFLRTKAKRGRALFERFVALVAACGPYHVAPAKTRVAFQLGKLAVHHLRLSRASDFDRELARWLRRSYVEYGERKWLTTR